MLKNNVILLIIACFFLSSCLSSPENSPEQNQKTVVSKSELISQLIRISDIEHEIEIIKGVYQKGLDVNNLKNQSQLDANRLKFVQLLLKNLDKSKYVQEISSSIDDGMASDDIQNILSWLNSETGKKIIRLEKTSNTPDSRRKMESFILDVQNLQVNPERFKLLKLLDKYTGTSDFALELQNVMSIESLFMSDNNNNSKAKTAISGDKNDLVRKKIESRTLSGFIFTYSGLDDRQLREYVDVMGTKHGQAFCHALNLGRKKALTDVVRNSLKELTGFKEGGTDKNEFADYNFRISKPDSSWSEMDTQRINPDATYCIAKSNPYTMFIIIAEQIGMENVFTTDDLLEVSTDNLKSSATEMTITEMKYWNAGGVEGKLYQADVTLNMKKLVYITWISSHNGYAYQLISIGFQRNRVEVEKHAKELIGNFELLDKDKEFYSKGYEPFNSYTSEQFAFTLTPEKGKWLKWTDLDEDYPEAAFAGYREQDGFVIFSLYDLDGNINRQAALKALLDPFDIAYHDENLEIQSEKRTGDAFESIYRYQESSSEGTYTYLLKFIESGNIRHLICAFTEGDKQDLKERFKDIFDGFIYNDAIDSDTFESQMTDETRTMYAQFYNSIGMFYFNKEEYRESISYYLRAHLLNKKEETFLSNLLRMYSYESLYQDGLKVLKEVYHQHSESPDIISWKAWFLLKTGDRDKALSEYKHLFESGGYRNNEDFKEYINILKTSDRWNEAEVAFERYLSGGTNAHLIIQRAKLYHDLEKYEDAVHLLETYSEGKAFNEDIAFALIQNYQSLGHYQKTIDTTDLLIEKGDDLTNAYYFKGDAQYYLKWYRKAKASLEKSLSYSPNDQDIKDYITHISSILGEGENSSIKTEIKAVPIPDYLTGLSLETKVPETYENYSSYFIHRITGIDYRKGKDIRTTNYRKIKLIDLGGVSQFSTMEIDFNPINESIYVNRVHVFNELGDKVSEGNESEYYVIDKQDSEMATYDKTLFIPVSNLKPGYTIDLVYTRKMSDSDERFTYNMHHMGSDMPVIHSLLYITGDTTDIQAKEIHVDPALTKDGTLYWIKNHPVIYKWEPRQVSYLDYMPVVIISGNSADWNQLGEEYLVRLKEVLQDSTEITEASRGMTLQAESGLEQIGQVLNYTQSELTYKPIEFGVRGLIPNSADKILANKYGDCKDHTILMYHLLKSNSVESWPALVNTDYSVQNELPSLDQFNHMILFVPDEAVGFVDATYKGQALMNLVPPDLAGRKALILKPGDIHFETIPDYKKGSGKISCTRQVELLDETTANIRETLALQGYPGGFMREFLMYKNQMEQEEWFSNTIVEYARDAELQTLNIEGLDDVSAPMTIHLEYQLKNPLESIGKTYLLKINSVWEMYYLDSEKVKTRRTDFKLKYPFEIESKVHVTLPPHMRMFAEDEKNDSQTHTYGMYHSRKISTGNGFDINFKSVLYPGVYNKDLYHKFVNFTEKAVERVSISENLTMINQ